MAYIKTKESVNRTIKTIDKATVASHRMKQAYIATKDKAEHSVSSDDNSPDEYAADRFQSGESAIAHKVVEQFEKQGRKGVQITKENYCKAKDGIQQLKDKYFSQSIENRAKKDIKKSAKSAGKKTIKSFTRGSAKTASKSIKTAEKTAKVSVKSTQKAAKAAQKAVRTSVKAAQKATQMAKASAKAAANIAKATIATVKAIIAGIKALVAAIAAGGWIAVVVIIIICVVALLLGSVFGIFTSEESISTEMTMQTAIQEISTEYNSELEKIKSSVSYDVLEIFGSDVVWKDVLPIYFVKINSSFNNLQEVSHMDEGKKEVLKNIFWSINEISSETKTEIEVTKTDNGNVDQTETTIRKTYLYITVSHKSVEEMAEMYGFNQEQRDYLTALLKEENNQLWSAALYGIRASDGEIVTVALSQVGNVGGEPY